jgi:hypothetical protein
LRRLSRGRSAKRIAPSKPKSADSKRKRKPPDAPPKETAVAKKTTVGANSRALPLAIAARLMNRLAAATAAATAAAADGNRLAAATEAIATSLVAVAAASATTVAAVAVSATTVAAVAVSATIVAAAVVDGEATVLNKPTTANTVLPVATTVLHPEVIPVGGKNPSHSPFTHDDDDDDDDDDVNQNHHFKEEFVVLVDHSHSSLSPLSLS